MRTDEATDRATWAEPRTVAADREAVLSKLFDGTCRLPLEMEPCALDPTTPAREALLDHPGLVDLDQDLFGLGFDSLDLVQVAAKLSAELDQDVPVSLFSEHPTLRVCVDNLVASAG